MKTQLKNNEKVIFVTKRYWISLILPVVIALIGTAAGIYFGSYAYILTLITIGYLAYRIIERNNDIWIVTNMRVIDEYGVFSINTKESPLDKINNISFNQTLTGKMLGYGDVQIQTAAEIGSTTYVNVNKPKELKDSITHMQEEYKQVNIRKQAEELAKAIVEGQKASKIDVASELEKLHELKLKGILTEEEFIKRKTKLLDS